jgi:soluble lytic murein transglycosylase-like protein
MSFVLVLLLATAAVGGPGMDRERAYDHFIIAATKSTAHVHTVPENLVRAVIRQESDFRPHAVSPAGAIGLMQVMPFNAARLGFTTKELRDPEKNIRAGVRLLAVLLKHYKGDVISALVAYNARPRELGAPIPRNGETPGYVRNVLRYYREYEQTNGRDLPQTSAAEPPPKTTPSVLQPSRTLR